LFFIGHEPVFLFLHFYIPENGHPPPPHPPPAIADGQPASAHASPQGESELEVPTPKLLICCLDTPPHDGHFSREFFTILLLSSSNFPLHFSHTYS
jgi:hypothetical protein